MPISRTLRQSLLTLPAAEREALALELLDLPRLPAPIAGGLGVRCDLTMVEQSRTATSITLVLDPKFGPVHPTHFAPTTYVYNYAALPFELWGGAGSGQRFQVHTLRVS